MGEPTYDSHLVRTCHRLRRKPLSEFTPDDLRIMIGQGVGLDFLVPLAVEVLAAEPLASGDFYPGDLLAAVARVESAFWRRHAEGAEAVRAILGRLRDGLDELAEADREMDANLLASIIGDDLLLILNPASPTPVELRRADLLPHLRGGQ